MQQLGVWWCVLPRLSRVFVFCGFRFVNIPSESYLVLDLNTCYKSGTVPFSDAPVRMLSPVNAEKPV